MIGRLRRLQLGLELVRGAVLIVVGARMAVAAASEFLAADKAATVAYLEAQAAAEAGDPEAEPSSTRPAGALGQGADEDYHPSVPAPAAAGGDDAA